MNKLYLIFLFNILYFTAQGQDTLKVLFLGNSYTQSHNLPELIKSLAASTGKVLEYQMHAPGGYQLNQHVADLTANTLMARGDWDFMVIQEQSQKPSFGDNYVAQNVYPYAKQLTDTFRHFNRCGQVIFYTTWGRKNGDATNCPAMPALCTYEGMDSLLTLRYQTMADSNKAAISPVGQFWRHIRNTMPNIELYEADESHPSVEGSYAAALTFYAMLFNADPSLTSYNPGIQSTVVTALNNAAKVKVFDSFDHWNRFNIGNMFAPLPADFTVNINNTTRTINLGFEKHGSTAFEWNFGDGNANNTDTVIQHTYALAGNYEVCLEVRNDCMTRRICKTINIIVDEVRIPELEGSEPTLYPNPTSQFVYITNAPTGSPYAVYNVLGQMVLQGKLEAAIDLSKLPPQVYTLHLTSPQQTHIFKIDKR